MSRVSVSAVIPTRDAAHVLGRCLEALAGAPEVDETIVVDDGSTDVTREIALEHGARILDGPGLGFDAAVNLGVAAARNDLVLLLNSDAFVRPDTVGRLMDWLARDDRLALCGPALVEGDGEPSKTHSLILTLPRALADAMGLRFRVPRAGTGLELVEAVWPTCALARRTALQDVGGMDERFLFYYGDMDLSRRLAAAGWRQAVDWDAKAMHLAGESTSRHDGPRWFESFHSARLDYLRKHYPRGWRLYAAIWALRAILHGAAWMPRAALRLARGDRAGASTALAWARAFFRTALPISR